MGQKTNLDKVQEIMNTVKGHVQKNEMILNEFEDLWANLEN